MQRNGINYGLFFLSVTLFGVVVWQSQRTPPSAGDESRRSTASSPSQTAEPQMASSSSAPKTGHSQSRSGPFSPSVVPANHAFLPKAGDTNQAPADHPVFDWRQVESEDYRTYIKNLRAIGCPEQTVEDIVAADLRQAYAAKRAEIMADRYRDFQFWKADTNEVSLRGDLESRRREVDEAMQAALQELMGREIPPASTAAEWQQAALGQQLQFLPAEKRVATQELLVRYAEADAQLKALSTGPKYFENAAERQHIVEVYDQRKAALQALLSPDEYEQLDMTTSWTGDNLRRAMTKFQPTEAEFRFIFQQWRQQDEDLAHRFATGQPDPGNDHVFKAIREKLGEERYQLYRDTWWE